MKKEKNKKIFFEYVPVWALVLFAFALVALAVDIAVKKSVAFADFIDNTIGVALRATLSAVTYIFPFSVAEFLLLSSPILVFLVARSVIKRANTSWSALSRYVAGFLALTSTVYTLFTFTMEASYYGTKLAPNMGIERRDVSAEELYDTACLLLDEIYEQIQTGEVPYPEGTYSSMPYTFDGLNDELAKAYKKVSAEYDGIDKFTSRTKPVILSPYWTYMHISGVYTFFTGEANVNTNYPDFIIASSAAHEMAHQHGVLSEDEANFLAFFVCYQSDDPYLRYAGCLDVYQDVRNALYSALPELHKKLMERVPGEVSAELSAYSKFFDKYRENVAEKVSTAVNNAYIQNHNQPAGVKSYGMVVDLVVSYMLYGE